MIVGEHKLVVDDSTRELANNYLRAFIELKGKKPKKENERDELYNDLLIIALATLRQMDVVYSEDCKTMFSRNAVSAYELVNNIKGAATPRFYSYEEFIKEIKRWLV